jgi:hypothetical protein
MRACHGNLMKSGAFLGRAQHAYFFAVFGGFSFFGLRASLVLRC